MAQHSLSDRVAIISMSCTRFAEHFDKSADSLAVDAVTEALDGPGLTSDDIDAFWLGTYVSGISGMALARPLRLAGKPVTRVENMCATGSEALRAAVHAVACGAVRLRDERRYRFESWFRTSQKKHKAFRSAIALNQRGGQ